MELLLNLLWLSASVILGVLLLKSRGRHRVASFDYIHSHSTAWICYLILIAMLLPVISMTDDLQSMVTLTDGEQIVRRLEISIPGHSPVHLHETMFLPVRNVLFAPVRDAGPLEARRESRTCYCSYRQTIQGRAPPVAG
jgi:hypothetical protein